MKKSTTQSIKKSDWQKLIHIVTQYVDAIDDQTEEALRKKILRYLARLNKKYPENVHILATKAEYIKSPALQLKYLSKAYQLATIQEDHQNLVLIASSFVDFYTEQHLSAQLRLFWINALEKHVQQFPDEFESAYLHLCKQSL